MECPVCNKAMEKVRKDITHNPNANNKLFTRAIYKCMADDVWVTTEIPRDESSK